MARQNENVMNKEQQIESGKRTILSMSISMLVLGVLVATLVLGRMKLENEVDAYVQERKDVYDKTFAVERLANLSGMIREIKYLSYKQDIDEDVLLEELQDIASFESDYEYLQDFTLSVPNTSDIEEICEELESQIDDQITIIMFGEKGA